MSAFSFLPWDDNVPILCFKCIHFQPRFLFPSYRKPPLLPNEEPELI